jgi:hypothetical protein
MNLVFKQKTAWRIGCFAIVLFSLIGGDLSSARNGIWVTVEGSAPMTAGNTKKARKHAIAAAQRSAVAQALTTEISIESLLVNLRLSGGLAEAIPFGRVVNMEILDEGPVQSKGGDDAHREMEYRIRIKACVERETGSKDPSFNLDATINRSVFKAGDELEIRIRSTKDCYIAIYNILENSKIIRLHPNYLSSKNSLSAGVDFIFPGAQKSNKGLKLLMHLPKNRERVTESIYILALTHPFKAKALEVQEGIYGVYNGQTALMKDLIREVASIPLDSRTEVLMQYEIRRSGK